MNTNKFQTNIKCGGCVATVTPFLNAETAIEKWEVDTNDPQKILTVTAGDLTPENVKQLMEAAGFQAQVL